MISSLLMYEILISSYFVKHSKPLIKKNKDLKENLRVALFNFNKEHSISIGRGVYKFRLSSVNKGKSGGYRLYVYVVEVQKMLTPIAIYSKNEKENLSFDEISRHLNKVKEELPGM